MKHGARPTKIDHRDYDLHRTFGSTTVPVFPDTFMQDAELWMPSQNAHEPIFNNRDMPFGCTNYTTADLCADADGKLYDPMYIENVTHANALGGYDIRKSLLTTLKGKHGTKDKDGNITYRTNLFNIRAYRPLDYFDAIRYAMMTGIPEKRSVSWGSPWFPSWERLALQRQPLIAMPTDNELSSIRRNNEAYGWHNSKFAGWRTINGVPYLANKSWQGSGVGDNGWLYFSREVVNNVMQIPGTVAFTVTALGADTPIKTIDLPVLKWLLSFTRQFLAFHI